MHGSDACQYRHGAGNRQDVVRVVAGKDIDMYNGLTIADKDALLDAQQYGAQYIARDASGIVYGYQRKPIRKPCVYEWYEMTWQAIGQKDDFSFVHWEDTEPIHIPTALAQIAEMESALPDHAPRHEQPMTLNDWLNGATVEEKAKWLYDMDVCRVSSISIEECNSYRHCTDCMRNLLNSPYTEGATT